MTLKDHPRLVLEIPRESQRFRLLHNYRSASERFNSTAKDDLHLLEKPRCMRLPRAGVLGVITTLTVFLKRLCDFILRCSATVEVFMERLLLYGSAPFPDELIAPDIPSYLVPFFQRE